MRQRVRPAYTAEQLAAIYPAPHDHTRWPDHVLRADMTVALCQWFTDVGSVADLSCGNGWMARHVAQHFGATVVLGDLAAGYEHHGPIEQTIGEIDPVDLFICTETLEHLDDPDTVLGRIREKAKGLIVSTPDAEPFDGDARHFNLEHYWTWDTDGVVEMLNAAGWTVEVGMQLQMPTMGVSYQLWALS